MLKSDAYSLLHAAATDGLHEQVVTFHDAHALTVVLASEGYPASPVKGRPITGLPDASETAWVNHAGTGFDDQGRLISTGGRVLTSTAVGPTLADAAKQAYEVLDGINLEGGHFRTDIGHRAL